MFAIKNPARTQRHSGLHRVNKFLKTASLPTAFILSAIAFTGHSRAITQQQSGDLRPLVFGSPIERELSGGQSHRYQLTLAEGEYFRLVVEQRGIDVVVALSGSNGVKLYEVDSPNGTAGTEEIPFVLKASGQYQLTVASFDNKAPAGKYEIKISELRPATERDEHLSVGERALAEADRLARRNDAGLMRQVISKYEEAAGAWRAAGEPAKEAEAIYGIATVHLEIGETQKAIEFLDRALPLYRQANDSAGEARIINNLGVAWGNLGDTRKALGYLQQALPMTRAAGEIRSEVIALSNIGAMHSTLGELQEALVSYAEALRIVRPAITSATDAPVRNDLRVAEGFILINICNAQIKIGEWQLALDACSQALPVLREQKEARNEGITLNKIGLALISIGEREKALESDLEALRILKQVGDRRNQAITLNDIGLIHYYQGEYARAGDYYQQSLALAKEVKNVGGQAVTLKNLGVVHGLLGERDKAAEALTQALSLFRSTGDRQGEAGVLQAIGNLAALTGNHRQAIEHHQQSLQISRAIKLAPQEATTLHFLAQASRELGELSQALTYGAEALRITESLRANVAGLDQRSAFFSTVQDRYDSHIETLMRIHQQRPAEGFAATALQVSERARARSLLQLLAEAGADIRAGVEPGLLAKERSLHQQISSKADAQTRLLGGKHNEAQAAAFAKEIADLTAQLKDLETEIRRDSPRYAALSRPEPLSSDEIQKQLLDEETLLLEYALGEKRSYLWLVSQNSISAYELPPRAEIEAATRKVYEQLTVRPKRGAPPDPQFITQAETLSRMLLGSAIPQLGAKRLVIVAPGILSYLPFAALPAPAGANGAAGDYQPLIARYELVNLPSASVLSVIRRETAGRRRAAKSVAVLADPVFEASDSRLALAKNKSSSGKTPIASSGASAVIAERSALTRATSAMNYSNTRAGFTRLAFSRQEAEGIYALASGGTGLKATDFNASRSLATSEALSQYRVLHFATHGLLNSERPELSGLVFSLVDREGKPQDGFLRLHEVYNLRFNSDLIVLSACETGLGKEIKGEGLIGLTRGFMHAGAPRVVASLWNVDDLATAELMKLFYQRMLKDGLPPAAALRAAQFELSKQKRWASPYFWAGFVLQGEWK